MRRRLAPAVVSALLACLASASLAAGPDLAAVPPQDPAFVSGTLPNGLKYWIRENKKPENRVELRLALKAGSVNETEAERGLAHFNEHMNFNGSPNFKSGDLVAYLESIGARFGADSNAYTSYDETVYFLQVPTDKEGALDKGLLILRDWAGAALLEAEEIDAERGVVNDELRRGKGAGKRIREKQDQVLFQGSLYADRTPIGLEKVILEASHDTVRGYYRKWYVPELMAIGIVGTIDAKAMEARVKELFGSIPASASPLAPIRVDVPGHPETLYSIESDKELTASNVTVYYKHDPQDTRTVGDLRRDFVDQMAGSLLTQRLSERAQKPDPPFLGASAGGGQYVQGLGIFTLRARAKDGGLPRAASALMEELDRALQHGFVQEELDRIKESYLSFAEAQWKERDQARSDQHAGAVVSSFLNDSPLTSADFDFETTKALVPGITLDEVNARIRSHAKGKGRVVLVQAPDKPGAVPTIDEMREAIEPKGGRQVEKYVDDLAGVTLMKELPASGSIVSRHAIPEIGVVELELSNGVKVAVKSTDFQNDEIRLSGFARGGTMELPLEDFLNAQRADTLAGGSGLADFTAPQLRKLLAGKVAGASPGVDLFQRSMGGSSTVKDFETMLQLVHLYFTRPAFREEAFRRLVDQETESIRNALNSPGGVFGRTAQATLYDGNPYFAPTTLEQVASLRRDEMERWYRLMFSDASEWTFVLVGNVDLDAHGPLLARYLGGLPRPERRKGAPPTWPYTVDEMSILFPQGRTSRLIMKGIEDQSRTTYAMFAPHDGDPEEAFRIAAAADLLSIRLREVLREKRGETYGASAGLQSLLPYKKYATVNIGYTGSPDTHGAMMRDVQAEIRRLKDEMPSEADVHKLKELRYKQLADSVKENGYWASALFSAYSRGRDPRTILDYKGRIDRLTARAVRDAARKYFDTSRAVELVLVPESWGPGRWLAKEAPAPVAAAAGASTVGQ